ncbi:MAG: DNA methyltransferase [Actinophytocola sp.]|nr:DNA methyltransferase [Actinophytocola sp.]
MPVDTNPAERKPDREDRVCRSSCLRPSWYVGAPRYGVSVDEELHERVRDTVAAIPEGTVATYGDIATLAGASTPRLVGRVLSEDGQDLPWHRVLRADGTPAKHLRTEQCARLLEEGVMSRDGRVDLTRYRWRPERR